MIEPNLPQVPLRKTPPGGGVSYLRAIIGSDSDWFASLCEARLARRYEVATSRDAGAKVGSSQRASSGTDTGQVKRHSGGVQLQGGSVAFGGGAAALPLRSD